MTYDPILATGERFCSGLITGSLISAELWLGAFFLLVGTLNPTINKPEASKRVAHSLAPRNTARRRV